MKDLKRLDSYRATPKELHQNYNRAIPKLECMINIIIKLLKVKDKEKALRVSREKREVIYRGTPP